MRKILIGAAFVGILLASHPAYPQAFGSGDLELNPYVGVSWHRPNDYEIGFPQSSPPEQKAFKLEQGLKGGVRLNVNNSGHWAQEFTYSYETNKTRFISRTPAGPELRLDVQVHRWDVNALYFFNGDEDAAVRPFATAGVGAVLYRPTEEGRSIANDPFRGNMPGFESSAQVAFNYGFGVKFRPGNRIGFRIDARGYLNNSPAFGIARSSDNPLEMVLPINGPMHNGEASAGLVFYLN
jgi:hypothetical protein